MGARGRKTAATAQLAAPREGTPAHRNPVSLLLALACLALLATATPASAQEPRDCFWVVGEDRAITSNFNWTDTGGRYYLAAVALPPGAEIVLRGSFPHSRYISFTSNNQRGEPVMALTDHEIVPEPGSTNPFLEGARRDAVGRDYEARIVAGPPPEEPEENTLYLAGPDGIGIVLYRIYLPDEGSGPTGGVGPPLATMRLADGTELDAPATCEMLNTAAPDDLNQLYEQFDGPSWPPTPPAQDPIVWERFFNAPYLVAGQLETTPAAGVREFVPATSSGGSLSALDIAYASARPHRGFGEVLVVEGRAPTFPPTRDGQEVMGSGQVRYWSLCQNELRRRSIDCLIDEDAILDAERRFTAVMSTPGSRPVNATAECGVNWILWGPNPDSLLILRHLLPADDFANSLAKVTEPGTEEEVVGEYLPVGRHMSREAFEARGCPSAAFSDCVKDAMRGSRAADRGENQNRRGAIKQCRAR